MLEAVGDGEMTPAQPARKHRCGEAGDVTRRFRCRHVIIMCRA
jgi:hypothetical protein